MSLCHFIVSIGRSIAAVSIVLVLYVDCSVLCPVHLIKYNKQHEIPAPPNKGRKYNSTRPTIWNGWKSNCDAIAADASRYLTCACFARVAVAATRWCFIFQFLRQCDSGDWLRCTRAFLLRRRPFSLRTELVRGPGRYRWPSSFYCRSASVWVANAARVVVEEYARDRTINLLWNTMWKCKWTSHFLYKKHAVGQRKTWKNKTNSRRRVSNQINMNSLSLPFSDTEDDRN